MSDKYTNLLKAFRDSEKFREHVAIEEFAIEVERLLEENGMNRSGLAKAMGCRPSYITKILTGEENVTLATASKVASALGAFVRIHLAPQGVVTSWRDRLISEATAQETITLRPDTGARNFEIRSLGGPRRSSSTERRNLNLSAEVDG